jgi:hypothetical protein
MRVSEAAKFPWDNDQSGRSQDTDGASISIHSGSVNAEVALQMEQGALHRSGASVALAPRVSYSLREGCGLVPRGDETPADG